MLRRLNIGFKSEKRRKVRGSQGSRETSVETSYGLEIPSENKMVNT